jgi:hypothetical protein
MIQIDELSNEVMTDVDISNRVASLIEEAYPLGNELKLMRMAIANPNDDAIQNQFANFHADVEFIREEGRLAKLKAADIRMAIAVERGNPDGLSITKEVQDLVDLRAASRPAIEPEPVDLLQTDLVNAFVTLA